MTKKSGRSKGLTLYANLAARRRSKVDAKARRKAEYLATLPKQPIKRLLYRLHPKRVFKFWFSKQGALTALKLIGVGLIIMVIFVAALFAYYRRELDAFSPSELAKRVATTVSKYYDRNGVLLWEDKGEGDYKLVIESGEIAQVMKDATIAIEDKDFKNHAGVSLTSIVRAGIANATGGEVQGASTLTQQLIKQTFFAEEAQQNRLSISRKIKEVILAIEVERMYTKDQILTLYLNQTPYGGRRNGVESAALTYFGKHAKELNVAEAALIASIPQNPSRYNPYTLTPNGTKLLIDRQHQVINNMSEQGYITKEQAEEAKKVPILDTVKPELADTANMKAPHFVLAVRDQLEIEFTTKVVREGGLTIKTTLDSRIQQVAEESISKNYKHATIIGANDMAATAVDVPTGQVLAMVGSYSYADKSFGAHNAAMSELNPGSSIKPFVYANLFKPQQGQNWGAGSILSDENIDSLYGNKLRNFDNSFMGAITIREALGRSRNPPAVKAAYIGGLDNAIQTARDAGDRIYCKKEGDNAGLPAAIGTCQVTQLQHTNAYATLARQGVYKPEALVLEVKNSSGQVIKQWKDESKKVIDSQITYILSDILTDGRARSAVFGPSPAGFNVQGVKTATKTGTTDDGHGKPKDSWMMSYTPRMAVGTWTGRNDAKGFNSLSSTGNANVVMDIQKFAHKEIFEKDGSWKPNDWFQKPAGVQTLTINGRSDIYPSWFVKPTNADGEKIVFDQVSRKKATNCTPERAKIELTVQVFDDPITKKKSYIAPDGYNATADDDVHKCEDVKPSVSVSTEPNSCAANATCKIVATVTQGTFPLTSVDIAVDGQVIATQPVSSSGSSYSVEHKFTSSGSKNISATVIDQGMYTDTDSAIKTVAASGGSHSILPIRRRS